MTQNEKDLLYKDLCARIPYNISVNYKGEIYGVLGITNERLVLCKPFKSQGLEYCPLVEEVKPYLFPLSSMTEEQKEEHKDLLDNQYSFDANDNVFTLQDFYCKYHLDYRGLIDMGLAIDATGKNIY